MQTLSHSKAGGELIRVDRDGSLRVTDHPIIGYIQGDGIGVDVWPAAKRVIDEAVRKTYAEARGICWQRLYAGKEAMDRFGTPLPVETLKALRRCRVGIKGPLMTPVGGGFFSVNVALRLGLDLYACIRPVRYIPGVLAPVRYPERVNLVIYRENTEDVYLGIEWRKGSPEARRVLEFLNDELLAGTGKKIRADSGIGVKPISKRGTERIVRMAIRHGLANKAPSVTLVHKGNIMKCTEGAFRDWGYALARREFPREVSIEGEEEPGSSESGEKRLVLNDRIADAMFQNIVVRPEEYSIICTMNLNGDYLSEACAALVGGVGMIPTANLGDSRALFEATHGTAPRHAGQDKVNPSSLILAGAGMLEYLGWEEAGNRIRQALTRTIGQRTVTYDQERQMKEAGYKRVKLLRCSEFAEAICRNME